jgi:hypothetical protein
MEKQETNTESFIGKECYYIDKTTHSKKFDGRNLGKCIDEGLHYLHKLPIVYFEKPFLGFTWQYKSNVRI